MTPRDALVVHDGPISLADAERLMVARKIKKLPLVDADGTLLGLITAKDLLKHRQQPFATRDAQGRLRVGAAVGATGDYLERAAELVRAGADVLVIDIAHGHSVVMARAIEQLRKRVGDVELVAGNVATAEGARFCVERGVNAIKVGIGPGGGCSHAPDDELRHPAGRGARAVPAGGRRRVPLIADGGIRRDGAIAQALLFGGDTVMLGSAFAGTEETPGEVVLKSVLMPESQKIVQVPFKVFRGMASIGAVRDRLDLEDADAARARGDRRRRARGQRAGARLGARRRSTTCSSTSARRSATAARAACRNCARSSRPTRAVSREAVRGVPARVFSAVEAARIAVFLTVVFRLRQFSAESAFEGVHVMARIACLVAVIVGMSAVAAACARSRAPSRAPRAADVTFTKDIAPILQRSCENCHRADGVAPMSLVTYEDVRPWARAIKQRTGIGPKAGVMPPWYVEKNIGIQKFQNDPSLSDDEIATIAKWADSGAPRGNPADMPPPQGVRRRATRGRSARPT